MSLNDTPRSERLHIGLFGRRNSGKSSLINAVTGQNWAIVSSVPGTTADPVYKAMEIHGIGPVVLIDTAGFDDTGELGGLRVDKTREAAEKTDLALLVFGSGACSEESKWIELFRTRHIPVIAVLTHIDGMTSDERDSALKAIKDATGLDAVPVSSKTGEGIAELREQMIRKAPDDSSSPSITGSLCQEGDVVLLVMPQDIQAPKGRLILPQVQVIRELLDKKCLPVCATTDKTEAALAALKKTPALVIVDSQTFQTVYPKIPRGVHLTSFSILFAGFKGDISAFADGARALEQLTENSRVLIAEACTHVPLEEDIGRVKIPRLLRARFGKGLSIDFARGVDFPENLGQYDLIIHCGACMFNRRFMLSRIARAQAAGVPITNYGIALAQLNGILDKVTLPRGNEIR
jgi:[FeFe] hydrogenase H-cluster maturation GTPase HydF